MHSSHQPRPLPAIVITFAMIAALLFGTAPRPAMADGAASTRNIILGAAAVAAGIIINNNVQRKNAAYNTVVGTTRDGGTVYADGRVVYPNGDTLYSSNGNGRPCGYYAGAANRCSSGAVAYYPQNYRGTRHDNGNHYGAYKHREQPGSGYAGGVGGERRDRDNRGENGNSGENGYHRDNGNHGDNGNRGDSGDHGDH